MLWLSLAIILVKSIASYDTVFEVKQNLYQDNGSLDLLRPVLKLTSFHRFLLMSNLRTLQ